MTKSNNDSSNIMYLLLSFIIVLLVLILFNFNPSAVIIDPVDDNGNLEVILQDPHTDTIDVYMMNMLNNVTLAQNTIVDNNSVVLVDGHNFSVGDWICLQEGNHLYQAEAVSINGNIVDFDSPLDYDFSTNAFGCRSSINMAVDGSVNKVIFRIKPQPLAFNVSWDVTRIICSISDNTAMDSGTFGGISALTNGFVIRKKDGEYKNLFNVKSNGQFGDIAYDISYDDKAPAGEFGFRMRKTWAGVDKSGVVIRLDPSDDDELQGIIQDDNSGNSLMKCRVIGSLTDEVSI